MSRAKAVLAAILILAIPGCGQERRPRSEGPTALAVNVMADTGRSERLHIERPPAEAPTPPKVWLAKVSPSRPDPLDPALPVPSPDLIEVAPDPPRLEVDQDLKPPILRRTGNLIPPIGKKGSVELDVRIDEDGDVSDALWAGGSNDSLLVDAAVSCALEMRFYPALQGSRPIAVWCRQRFDFGESRGGRR